MSSLLAAAESDIAVGKQMTLIGQVVPITAEDAPVSRAAT